MGKTRYLVLVAALSAASGGWAQSSPELEQTLEDYQARLEQLEADQYSAGNLADKVRINGFLSAGMSRAYVSGGNGDTAYIDGTEDNWRHDVLTRAGVQFNASLSDRAEAVIQLLASGDDEFDASVQWAYLDYDLTDTVSVKAGRIVAPFYMHSQYVDVGYAYPWVSLPAEVYQLAPIKTFEGLEAAWRANTGPVSHRLAAFWGSSIVDGGKRVNHARYQAEDLAGLNITSHWRDWTFRAAYSGATVSVSEGDLKKALGFEPSTVGLSFDEVYTYFAGLGLQYDNGSWFFSAERARLGFSNWYASSESGYVSVGKYLGKWMPLLTWAELNHHDIEDTALTAQQIQGSPLPLQRDSLQNALAERQKSWTAGVRYALSDSISLKAAYSYYYDFSDEYVTTSGYFVNNSGRLKDDHASVVRLSADLVF